MFILSTAAMAAKTRSANSPADTPHDSLDPNSQQSSLAPALDTLALVLEQMALINARFDAQTANAATAVAAAVAEPHVTMRPANPRAMSSPWNCSHHLHRTLPPDVPFLPSDLSSQRRRRITSPPPAATRIRTARRLQ
jgi:hypothetical protein